MKMFVVSMKDDNFIVKKGLHLTYGLSGKKTGFKKFWMASIENEGYKQGIYLSKDIQKDLPEFPDEFTDIIEITGKTRIDDIKFIKHPTIDDKWMAVKNESNHAIVFFTYNFINAVFPITKSNKIVEKDCPYNHRLTGNVKYADSYDKSNCALCGSKLIKRHDDKSFLRLAEKHGIEIGDNKSVCNFLHINDGKINMLTTNCESFYELSLSVDNKFNDYPSFELIPGKKTLIGVLTDENIYILSILFNGTDIELNVERKHIMFDFTYTWEKENAERTLKKLIESREKSNLVLKDSTHSIEDSPFAILKNMKFN